MDCGGAGWLERIHAETAMACPNCLCIEVYVYDDEDEPSDDRLQRCTACGLIFDLDDHIEENNEDEDERQQPSDH